MARTLALQKNGVDPVGAPDFTLPVSILAQIIESLKVDIVAQSIPKLQINIASISSGVVFNVAQSGAWTVNAAQTGAWTINIGQPLDASGNLKTSIQTSVTLNVNIVGSTTLNINIASITSGVIFNVAQSGTWTINIGQPLDASGNLKTAIQSSVTINVNVTNSSLNVYVTNSSLTVTVSGTADVYVTNSSLTVTVSGTANVAIVSAIVNISSLTLMDSGTIVNVHSMGSGTTSTLYTVPSGKKLYIYSVLLNIWHYSAGTHHARIYLYDGANQYNLLELYSPDNVDQANEAVAFTLRSITAGWQIWFAIDSTTSANTSIIGVLVNA